MSHRPDIRVYEGANDITDDVLALDFYHGNEIFHHKTQHQRFRARGEMVLDNWDAAWGVTELDSLGVIELRRGTDILCRAVVLEYEFNRREVTVRCTLAANNATAYLGSVMINAGSVPGASGMSLTLSQVLGAAGVTITPEEALPGTLNMDQGTVYEATIPDFLDAFAVAADGFVYEDHLGAFRFMAWADNRAHTLQITPADLWIEDETAESYLRSGWRRDAQIVKTLDVTFIEDGGTFDADNTIASLGYWQTFTGIDHVRILHMTPLRQVAGITYSEDIDRFAYHSSFDQAISISTRPPPYTGPIPTWTVSAGTPFINPDNPQEILVRIQLNGSGFDWNSLWLDSNYRVTSQMYPETFTENTLRLTTRDDGATVLGERHPMPWPLDDAALAGAGSRLALWATRVPRVTKLCFPLIQQTEARFNSLVNHRIGSISSMDITVDGLEIAGFMANLYVRWRYERGGYSCVEMHFLELGEHAAQRPLHADVGFQLEAEDDRPIFVE